jgi:fructuronate reductase
MDTLLAHDTRWGICGVELRGRGLKTALAQQDNLYTVAEIGGSECFRVIGAVKRYLTAVDDTPAIFAQLLDPTTRLVTLTVTEKGYCLSQNGELDQNNPEIIQDVSNPDSPVSVIGWITRALQMRKAAKMKPFVALSCDNVAGNGRKLRRAVLDYAALIGDESFVQWIGEEVRFPLTMVDSITPATTPELIARINSSLGYEDKAPVNREAFLQWVVEDHLGDGAPDLAAVGAILTHDVEHYEQAKLRLLNGTHSTLAYIGQLRGYETVGEAMQDRELASFIETMMRFDIAATLRPAPGLDIPEFIVTILGRYRNPGIQHKLAQIGSDGSQKVPYRLLAPISELIKQRRPIDRMAIPIAAWLRFIVLETRAGRSLSDPVAPQLASVAGACIDEARHDVKSFLPFTQIFPRDLAQHETFIEAVIHSYQKIASGGHPWAS